MSGEKRITVEDIFGDFGFRVKWSVVDHWADIEVYEVESRGTELNSKPQFHRKGAACSPDGVEDISEAEKYLEGYIKWDGCTELDMGCPHWCGPSGYVTHCELLKYIYRRAHELMGREPEDAWPSIEEALR